MRWSQRISRCDIRSARPGRIRQARLFISQDDQVAALALLIDQLGDAPIFLSGISFGGLIALQYAIAHADRLAGLIAMSASPSSRLNCCCLATRCAPA